MGDLDFIGKTTTPYSRKFDSSTWYPGKTGTETPYTFYPRSDIKDFTTDELLNEIKRRMEK